MNGHVFGCSAVKLLLYLADRCRLMYSLRCHFSSPLVSLWLGLSVCESVCMCVCRWCGSLTRGFRGLWGLDNKRGRRGGGGAVSCDVETCMPNWPDGWSRSECCWLLQTCSNEHRDGASAPDRSRWCCLAAGYF